jgi:hypothetical protein
MSDLTLNPQLGARLKGLQQFWGHDSPSETLATIFDAVIYKWSITLPQIVDISVGVVVKVRLKNRHQVYFSQMSQLIGCSVPELARSTLIQWLCFPSQAQIAPQNTQMLPSKSKKTAKKPQSVLQPPKTVQKTTQVYEESTTKEEKITTTGRTALSGLLKK